MLFMRMIKNNQISRDVTPMCSLMAIAGMRRVSGPVAQLKSIRESGWRSQTMARQSWNMGKKHFFGLAEQNGCKKRNKNSRYSKGDTDIHGMDHSKQCKDIQYNERQTDLSDGKIVGTYHFRIRHLGSSTRALIAGAQKREQFSLHKEKAESLSKKIKLTWIHKKRVFF